MSTEAIRETIAAMREHSEAQPDRPKWTPPAEVDWRTLPLQIPEPEHRAMLARIERMRRAPVTEEQRRREAEVIAQCSAAAELREQKPTDPVAADLATLREQCRAAYKQNGWTATGHVMAAAVGRVEQAADFAEVATKHPKQAWEAFESLFRDTRAGKAKTVPAAWFRTKCRALEGGDAAQRIGL